MDALAKLTEYARLTEDCLDAAFPPAGEIIEAVRYSLLGGGKRVRPGLLLEFYSLFGGEPSPALPFAAGLEMIHTYSLIHDDLPCMDNDDLRRGKPSSHKQFGEAMALLAGDALLNGAFESMAHAPLIRPERALRALGYISRKSGAAGMIGGQVIDLALEGAAHVPPETHRAMIRLKTGALFEAACAAGCILAGGTESAIQTAADFGRVLGAMFQLSDDMLDVTGTADVLGKPVGSDVRQDKRTFVTLYGMEACSSMLADMETEARTLLADLPASGLLDALVAWMAWRKS